MASSLSSSSAKPNSSMELFRKMPKRFDESTDLDKSLERLEAAEYERDLSLLFGGVWKTEGDVSPDSFNFGTGEFEAVVASAREKNPLAPAKLLGQVPTENNFRFFSAADCKGALEDSTLLSSTGDSSAASRPITVRRFRFRSSEDIMAAVVQ